jgi:uncharacterized protein DUF4037
VFFPGLELASRFYAEVVRPLVGDRPHSAALLGFGSDVLGFGTERSTDHGWGPRLQLFVAEARVEPTRALVDAGLPETFVGWPTHYGWDDVPVGHHVEVTSVGAWMERQLGFDPRRAVTILDWLTTPQQLLREVTGGAVFHDGLGELAPVRDALAWYPRDVWLWLLACQWRRVDQEEPFVGRTAEVGDELGSRLIAARLCRDVMRLCFLLERRYAPYAKWLGSAFARLDVAAEIGPALADALAAPDHAAREDALVRAYEAVARRQNELGITAFCDPTVREFHSRPFRVLGSGRFVDACLEQIEDERLRAQPLVGSVDQLADSTDVLGYPLRARRVAAFYDGLR